MQPTALPRQRSGICRTLLPIARLQLPVPVPVVESGRALPRMVVLTAPVPLAMVTTGMPGAFGRGRGGWVHHDCGSATHRNYHQPGNSRQSCGGRSQSNCQANSLPLARYCLHHYASLFPPVGGVSDRIFSSLSVDLPKWNEQPGHNDPQCRHNNQPSRETAPAVCGGCLIIVELRRRPTLPGSLPPSTIGAGRLNFRVRDGNGCFPAAMATGNLARLTGHTPKGIAN